MKKLSESNTDQNSPFDLLPSEDVHHIALLGGGVVGQALSSVARRFRYLSSDEAYYRDISRREISQNLNTKGDKESYQQYYQRYKYNLLLPVICAQQSGSAQIRSTDSNLNGLPPLHAAAKANADQLFLQLLSRLPDDQKLAALLANDERGNSVLSYICETHNMIMLRHAIKLIPKNDLANVFFQARANGLSLFQDLVNANDIDGVKLLLAMGILNKDTIDVALQTVQGGYSLLHFAVCCANRDGSKSVEILNLLLPYIPRDRQAEFVFMTDHDPTTGGTTVLERAVLRGNTEAVRTLWQLLSPEEQLQALQHNTGRGQNILHLAAHSGNAETFRFILNNIPVELLPVIHNQTDFYLINMLEYAIRGGNHEIISAVVAEIPQEQRLATLRRTGDYGDTPLHQLAQAGLLDSFMMVLSQIPPDQQLDALQQINGARNSVIGVAAQSRNGAILEWIRDQYYSNKPFDQILSEEEYKQVLSKGRDVAFYKKILPLKLTELEKITFVIKIDNYGRTLLHLNAREGQFDSFKYLLSFIPSARVLAELTRPSESGTPLSIAFEYADNDKTQALIINKILSKNDIQPVLKDRKGCFSMMTSMILKGDFIHLESFLKKIPSKQMAQVLMSTGEDNSSLLHAATASRRLICINLIMDRLTPEQQLEMLSRKFDDKTAIEYAKVDGFEPAVALLQKYEQNARLALEQQNVAQRPDAHPNE